MMKNRFLAAILAAAMLLGGCGKEQPQLQQYQASFLTLFDTVTYISGFAESEEAFSQKAQAGHDELLV